jgi:hypothetical protein
MQPNFLKFRNSKDFAGKFQALLAEVHADPIEQFVKHPWFMDFNPTPAQMIALKTMFGQAIEPEKEHKVRVETKDENGDFFLEEEIMNEGEIYELMTARSYKDANHTVKNKINLIIGRRGGKTTLAAMLAIYCAIKLNWKKFLHKTPFATVLILSHSREFSEEVLEIIRTFIDNSPVLKKLKNNRKKNSASTMNLAIPFISDDGKIEYSRVQIKVGAASSKTTRGIAACAVLCDEIAYWNLEDTLKETDEKILKAVRPATKQFGSKAILIKLSSPGIRQGVLYKEYEKWREEKLPDSYVVFKAPSWVWNDILPSEEFEEEWQLDAKGFDSEYRANFVDALSNFIVPEFTDLAVMPGVKFLPPEAEEDGVTYSAAIDAAFKGDVFTFSVIGHFENRLKQYVIKGWEGTPENPVKASDVAKFARIICKQYGIDFVAADQYSFQPLREIFEQFGVTLKEYPFSITYKKKIYFNLKRRVHSQQIDLLDNDKLIKEIKELVVEQTPSGQIRIGHPAGGSDDYADATAIASYLATQTAGQLGVDFEASMSKKDYGVKTDSKGRTFKAPPPELLGETYGVNILDNSASYMKHPETGKLMRVEDYEDEDPEDPNFSFS